MHTFFDENGFLNLDGAILEMKSFKTIMEDGIVTDDELAKQADHVTGLLRKLEEICSEEQAGLVKELLAEMNVLFAVYHYKEIQTLR